MIDKKTEELTASYVLDLLDRKEREAFEASLADSASLRRYLREVSSGLHQPVKTLPGTARPDLLEGILRQVEQEQPEPSVATTAVQPATSRRLPWGGIWAAAAAVLLTLNLFLLFIVNGRQPNPDLDSAPTMASTQETLDNGTTASDKSGSNSLVPSSTILDSRIERLEQDLDAARTTLAAYEEEKESLARENAEVINENTEWQREYERLAARFLPFFEPNDGLGRFTVIEMVDAEAFDTGLPRRGFADLAGRFLTGEGNIAGIEPGEFVGPIVEGAGATSATLQSGSALTPVAGFANREPSATTDETDSTAIVSNRPTGFTVWRDDEQKGFLDIYNLPDPPVGREAFLWVRSSELEEYIPVGNLPTLENGTGSMFYSVDEPDFTPVDILITAEPEAGDVSNPSGFVLLRGP